MRFSELSAKAKKDRLDKQLVNSTDLEMEISKLKQQLEVVESLLSVNKALKIIIMLKKLLLLYDFLYTRIDFKKRKLYYL